MESRDVTFFENIFLMKETYSLPSVANEFIPKPTLTIESIENPLEDKEGDNELAPRRSKISNIVKSSGEDFTVYLVEDTPQP
jgi:RNA recognition motif-containing protein